MVGNITLLNGSLPHLNNFTVITQFHNVTPAASTLVYHNVTNVNVQMQNPWELVIIQFGAVFFGALASGYISYLLQEKKLKVQAERDKRSAYVDLLDSISKSSLPLNIDSNTPLPRSIFKD